MKTITQHQFDVSTAADPYYEGRWGYMRVVCRMIEALPICKVLEIGACRLRLVPSSLVMDITYHGLPDTVIHDARRAPWPFEDDQFDLLVALQVWEHLGEGQVVAMQEAIRVAKFAILSLPWQWTYGEEGHVGIDDDKLILWTCFTQQLERVIVGSVERKRIIVSLDLRSKA